MNSDQLSAIIRNIAIPASAFMAAHGVAAGTWDGVVGFLIAAALALQGFVQHDETQAMVLSLVRSAVGAAGGYCVQRGWANSDSVMLWAAVASTFVPNIWTWFVHVDPDAVKSIAPSAGVGGRSGPNGTSRGTLCLAVLALFAAFEGWGGLTDRAWAFDLHTQHRRIVVAAAQTPAEFNSAQKAGAPAATALTPGAPGATAPCPGDLFAQLACAGNSIRQFTVNDLQAALDDANAQTPPDTRHAPCWAALIVVAQNANINPLPSGLGLAQLIQKAFDDQAFFNGKAPWRDQLATACALTTMDIRTDLLSLVNKVGAGAALNAAVPGLGLVMPKL